MQLKILSLKVERQEFCNLVSLNRFIWLEVNY